jgi:hypothetical protein
MISTLVCFSKSPLSNTMLEAAGQHIPENIQLEIYPKITAQGNIRSY